MNRPETLLYQRSIIQAAIDGKSIQLRAKNVLNQWEFKVIYPGVSFNFYEYEYRITPEPEEVFINIYSWGKAVHDEKAQAERHADENTLRVAVKFREVIEDKQV